MAFNTSLRMGKSLLKSRAGKVALGCCIALVVNLVAIEVALRSNYGLLSGGLADQVYTSYRDSVGGIFFSDPVTKVRLMWPNRHQEVFSHGYFWQHQTDSLGFRNPAGTPTRILVMGDSHMYGHGVQGSETTAAYLSENHGRGAYNMGRQGDCLYQFYVLCRLYVEELKPDIVIAVIFGNDFDDILHYRGENPDYSELDWDYKAFRERARTGKYKHSSLHRFFTYRLFRAVGEAYKARNAPPRQGPLPVFLQPDRIVQAKAYTERVLPEMARVCKQAGAELRVVYLYPDYDETWGVPLEEGDQFLAGLCAEEGIPYLSTRELFVGKAEDYFLPNDGHLNPAGHQALAAFIDRWLSAGSSSPGDL